MKGAKVLVTGATGFVGNFLVKALLSEEAIVTGIGRSVSNVNENFDYVCCDLSDGTQVKELFEQKRWDYIFHLAGENSANSYWDSWISSLVLGTANLLAAINQPLKGILIVGSAHEYQLRGTDIVVPETHPIGPLHPYGWSKHLQVQTALWYAEQTKLPIVIARPFNLIGPGNMGVCGELTRQIVEIELQQRPPVLHVGDVDIARDFLDVRDATRAFISLISSAQTEIYNVCSGKTSSLREIIQLLSKHTNTSFKVEADRRRFRSQDPRIICGCNHKLIQKTNWHPVIDLQQTLIDMIASERTNYQS